MRPADARRLDVFADPSCAWCWTALEWIQVVSELRDLTVRVRPYSLRLRHPSADLPPVIRMAREGSHCALRVLTAIDDAASGCRFFTAYSAALFGGAPRAQLPDIVNVLSAAGCDPALAAAADDAGRDATIRAAMDEAASLRGLPPGLETVPIVVFRTPSGPIALDGPLVDLVPTGAEATDLWDALVTLATTPGVFGITRPRTAPHRVIESLQKLTR